MRKNIHAVTLENVTIRKGFWAEIQNRVHDITMWNVYNRFKETGRFEAFKFNWREGMSNRPHIFWDSDVAKWLEAVGYFCEKQREPEMEAIVDEVVDDIEKNRMSDGYFNSYFGHLDPENRFKKRDFHELYCAGHLIEAAIAYKRATGKDKFLRLMSEYADCIYQVFYVERSAAFTSPGHEEIELALVKLYRETGNKKYLDLSLYFVEQRGTVKYPEDQIRGSYIQDHLPIREQKTAEGHAVRACYLFCAVADLALETGDETLFEAAKELFFNITRRRMYVTGAIGQTPVGEAFMNDFDLPNQTAYAETCANLSLALFARRMSLLDPDSVYADTAERVLYNSFLSGISLDGKSFFYSNLQENDLEVRHRKYDNGFRIFCPDNTRVEVFECSCCPPNVVRTVASVADFQYSTDDETVWIHQYFSSIAKIGEKKFTVETGYPYDGKVKITYSGKKTKLAIRIPGWCTEYKIAVNGKTLTADIIKGYAYLNVNDGDMIESVFDMSVNFVEADPRVWEDAGRVAVMRGPVVYCMESLDNPGICLRDIRLEHGGKYSITEDEDLGVPALITEGYIREWKNDYLYGAPAELKPCRVKLIPYFAFANRGETDMLIWTLKK